MNAIGVRLSFIYLIAVAGCSGGGNVGLPRIPNNPLTSTANLEQPDSLHRRTIPLNSVGKALVLPSIDGVRTRLTIPTNNAPAGARLAVTLSKSVPFMVSRLPERSKPLLAVTLESSANVTMSGTPKFVVQFASPVNRGVLYARIYKSERTWDDLGSVRSSGSVVTFGGGARRIKLETHASYVVILFKEPAGMPLLYDAEDAAAVFGFPLDANGGVFAANVLRTRFDQTGIAFDSNGRAYLAVDAVEGCPDGIGVGVYVFPAGASGDTPPIASITGPHTGITSPADVALDASSNIYVSDANTNGVLVFAAGANGDVAPIRSLSGPLTGIASPNGLAIDGTGKLYVVGANGVTIYAAGASGNTAPIATIAGGQTGLDGQKQIALGPTGNIYVLNTTGSFDGSVTVYSPGSSGNVPPIAMITGPATGILGPSGLAVDAAGEVFVGGPTTRAITVYPPGANGDVAPIRTITDAFDVPGIQGPEAFAIH